MQSFFGSATLAARCQPPRLGRCIGGFSPLKSRFIHPVTNPEGELSMSPQAKSRTPLAPDKAPLTKSQATALASLTGIDASKLHGRSVAEIAAEFRWQIDPTLLLFTRVCGQVVKHDPATGNQYPVPFATVYAEETVCSRSEERRVGKECRSRW